MHVSDEPRADNVLRGPWPDPAVQKEREELTLRLGSEEAWCTEHVVFSRHVLKAPTTFVRSSAFLRKSLTLP